MGSLATTPVEINFGWLIRLRWATIAGQALTIAAVRFGMGLDIPIGPLYALVALAVAVNFGCLACARVAEPREWWLLAVMAFDVLLFSGLLYFTGGPENPFSFLYLVPIALAAITLRPASTWALVMLSLASSAVLFLHHRPMPLGEDHASHMTAHLRGMWVAFGVAAAFIVYFLLRVRRALSHRDDELAASRNLAERQERLASLATLAAGAAHELPRRCRPSPSWPRTSSARWPPRARRRARRKTCGSCVKRSNAAAGSWSACASTRGRRRAKASSPSRCVISSPTASATPPAPPRPRPGARSKSRSTTAPPGSSPSSPAGHSPRPSGASSTTRATLLPRARRCRSGSPASPRDECGSRSPTAGPASRPRSCRGWGSLSSPPNRPVRGWVSASSSPAPSSSAWADSSTIRSSPGAGTIATLSLTARGRIVTARGTLLLVDDDEVFRERLGRALRDRSYDVVTAGDHDAALAAGQGRGFDFAVVDLRMPSGSGLALIEPLLAQAPRARIVVLTGYGSIASAVDALRLGAHDYLPKPVDADEIIAALGGPGARPTTSASVDGPAATGTPTLARAEWEHVQRVLADCNNNISEAARRLGITRRTLQLKLKKYPPRV